MEVDSHVHSEKAAAWVISDAGYKRFRRWEKLFEQFPLAGVPPHIAASKLCWADADNTYSSGQ